MKWIKPYKIFERVYINEDVTAAVSEYSLKLINGIKYNSPELYKEFEKFGGPEKIKIGSEMGGLGFE